VWLPHPTVTERRSTLGALLVNTVRPRVVGQPTVTVWELGRMEASTITEGARLNLWAYAAERALRPLDVPEFERIAAPTLAERATATVDAGAARVVSTATAARDAADGILGTVGDAVGDAAQTASNVATYARWGAALGAVLVLAYVVRTARGA
jgi:hypothetical protein